MYDNVYICTTILISGSVSRDLPRQSNLAHKQLLRICCVNYGTVGKQSFVNWDRSNESDFMKGLL